MHRSNTFGGRFGVVVAAAVIACQMVAPTMAWAHGGGFSYLGNPSKGRDVLLRHPQRGRVRAAAAA
jgi:hypothetical protein